MGVELLGERNFVGADLLSTRSVLRQQHPSCASVLRGPKRRGDLFQGCGAPQEGTADYFWQTLGAERRGGGGDDQGSWREGGQGRLAAVYGGQTR